jgi:hypothetical protein
MPFMKLIVNGIPEKNKSFFPAGSVYSALTGLHREHAGDVAVRERGTT